MNEEEKRIILDILEDLKKSNELDNQDIGIITGYSGQKDILRNSVKAIGYDKIAQIDINVLDAFQGRENDIIMYSTVRTDNSIRHTSGEEKTGENLSLQAEYRIIILPSLTAAAMLYVKKEFIRWRKTRIIKKILRHPIQTIQVNMKMSVTSAADRRVLRER